MVSERLLVQQHVGKKDAAIKSSPSMLPRPSSIMAATLWKVFISLMVIRACCILVLRSATRFPKTSDLAASLLGMVTFIQFRFLV